IGALIEALRDADKRGTKAIDRALSAWLDTPRATLSYRYALQAASDQLRELEVPLAAALHTRVEARLTERLKVTPIERHFEALKRADGTERMELIDKISKYFAYKQITPGELTHELTIALAHPDRQTRKALADVVTDAQWSLDRPMTLLEHSDEAVRQGAQERFAYLKPLIEAARPLTAAQLEKRKQEAKRAHERRLEQQRANGVDPRIEQLLRELFDDDMRERWGWGEHFEVGWRTEPGPLSVAKVGRVSCMALRVSFYMLSSVTVDLRARRVVCEAIDQKTPQDTVWTLHPSADWWRRAMQCPIWPVGERFEDIDS
ncbi:MAG TPA: hypothetical protein DCQ06_01170, partial [Myxococcales bacterium]|nr:hypothetical protein [Myxococcales bacterium]